MKFPSAANVLRYRVSEPLWIFTIFIAGIISFSFYVAYYKGNLKDAFIGSGVFSIGLILIHLQQLGYRAAWDKDRLYVRKWGILNGLGVRSQITTVPWDGVEGIVTSVRWIYGRDEDYRPDEFLEFHFRAKGSQKVRVYPYMTNLSDFEEFASFVGKKFYDPLELN